MEFVIVGLIVIPWSIIGLFLYGRHMDREEAKWEPIDYSEYSEDEIEEDMSAAYVPRRPHVDSALAKKVFEKLLNMGVGYALAQQCARFGVQKTDSYEVALQRAWQQVKKGGD